jgi:hypothetical protein
MAMTSFSLPKHWEDWIGAALGLWLLASPSVIPYGVPAASQNAFLGGVLLLAIAFVEITTFRAWDQRRPRRVACGFALGSGRHRGDRDDEPRDCRPADPGFGTLRDLGRASASGRDWLTNARS